MPLRRYLHAPTFILANVIVDVEPFFVLFYGLRYPLHGSLHTFMFAIPIGLAFGCVMFFLERFLRQPYRTFLLETANGLSLKSFVIAGGLGTGLHVLLDAPLYSDIKPSSNSKSPLQSSHYLGNLKSMHLDRSIWNNILHRIIKPYNFTENYQKESKSRRVLL